MSMYVCMCEKKLAFWEAKKQLKTQKVNIPGHRDCFDPLLNVNFNVRMGSSTSEKSVLGDFRRVDLPLAGGEKFRGASSPPPRKLLQREVISNRDLTREWKKRELPCVRDK